MKKIKFYDTSSLLLKVDSPHLDQDELVVISSITLEELEQIKTASNKDNDIKYAARQVTRWLERNTGNYEIVLYNEKMNKPLLKADININNDAKILACGLSFQRSLGQPITFVTNDLCLKHIASMFFDNVEQIKYNHDRYTGYVEVELDDDKMAEFYQDMTQNYFDLLPNQYLLIRNKDKEVVDIRAWTGIDHRSVDTRPINSKYFGKINAYDGDSYQKMAMDSLRRNQLTVLRGPAGSGKSLLGLAYMFSLLETHQIEKICIFCNPVATKDSAKLGLIMG